MTAKKTANPAVKHPLSLCVQYVCADHELLPTRPRIRRWVKAALDSAAEVTIRFVNADEGRELNHSYRGKDYATNVLTFSYSPAPALAGDIVISLPVVLAEAAAQGKSPEAHFAHLIVHGMLHLQGFEHEGDEAEAEKMEAREREIMAALGFPDPYLERSTAAMND